MIPNAVDALQQLLGQFLPPNLSTTVFSTLAEIHAFELGIAFGLIATLFSLNNSRDYALMFLVFGVWVSMGFFQIDSVFINLVTGKPWYFLLPMTSIPFFIEVALVIRASTSPNVDNEDMVWNPPTQ